MTEPMVRAQILLDPRQRRRLEELAQREGRSISAVTRQIIDIGLEQIENEAEIWNQRARILSGLRSLRERQPVNYSGDLINEARQEREEERDALWDNAA
jgi:predicted DNA-binding protein